MKLARSSVSPATALGLVLALGATALPRPVRAEAEVSAFGGETIVSPRFSLGRPSPRANASAYGDSATLGARFAYFPHPNVGGELELAVTPTSANDGTGILLGSLRGHVMVNVLTGRVRPFLFAGGGGLVASVSDPLRYTSEIGPVVDGGLGVRVDVGDWWGLRADGRVAAAQGKTASNGSAIAFDPEWTVGIYGRFPAPPPPEARGAGPLIEDRDHDGVGDALDKCPDVPGPVRNYGCPADEDRDHDGLADKDDKCPDSPGTAATGGCGDKDGDGLLDPDDKCPDEAGPEENKGCPDRDKDGDGIIDRFDKCPDQPETKNGYQDDDGCPDKRPDEPVVAPPIKNLDALAFEKGSTTLTAASLPILDDAADVLKTHPEASVEIVGHTDASGQAGTNVRLSRARAEAVRDYLIAHGIDGRRLTATGKGSSEPLVAGTSEDAAQKNRRVEFRYTTTTTR